jgi:hypothetical protein
MHAISVTEIGSTKDSDNSYDYLQQLGLVNPAMLNALSKSAPLEEEVKRAYSSEVNPMLNFIV